MKNLYRAMYLTLLAAALSASGVGIAAKTILVSDSTHTSKIAPTNVSPYAPSFEPDTTALPDYKAMMPCPGDPRTAAQPGSNWPTRFICPNINGSYASAQDKTEANNSSQRFQYVGIDGLMHGGGFTTAQAYCPDQCAVTQLVQKTGTTITNYVAPICPDGYAQVAVFNLQPEIEKVNSTLVIPPPIQMADYAKYYAAGYTCTPSSTYDDVEDRRCVQTNDSRYNLYANRVSVSSMGISDTPGAYTQDGAGIAGQYVPEGRSGFCYLDNVPKVCDIPSGTGNPHPGQTDCFGPGYLVLLDYKFFKLQCSAAAGSYVQTLNSAPASLVCARIKGQWKNANTKN